MTRPTPSTDRIGYLMSLMEYVSFLGTQKGALRLGYDFYEMGELYPEDDGTAPEWATALMKYTPEVRWDASGFKAFLDTVPAEHIEGAIAELSIF